MKKYIAYIEYTKNIYEWKLLKSENRLDAMKEADKLFYSPDIYIGIYEPVDNEYYSFGTILNQNYKEVTKSEPKSVWMLSNSNRKTVASWESSNTVPTIITIR